MSARETESLQEDEPAAVPTPKPTPKPPKAPINADEEDEEDAPISKRPPPPPKVAPPEPSSKGLNAAETNDSKAPGLIDSCTGDNKATTEVGTVCGDAARANLGLILGISGGVIAFLLLVALYFWKKRRNAKERLLLSGRTGPA